MELQRTFEKFIDDDEAPAMYITGVAGTGKTTSLKELLEYCIEHNISTVTCAYTHKAVGVLRGKIPLSPNNVLCTLHSYLKKRPSINDNATRLAHVDGNAQVSIPEQVKIIFIDEFSMVGDKDYVDINDIQYNEDGELVTKVIYIGDPNQLPPVKDQFSIIPKKPYWVQLTQIYRQKGDSPLIDTLISLNDYISGKSVAELKPHAKFKRKQDIVELYKNCKTTKILLAFTNAQVEALNAEVQGYSYPVLQDTLFSPTTRDMFTLAKIEQEADYIVNIRGNLLENNSKYKTLETLHTIKGIEFYTVVDAEGNETRRAVIFGHDTFLQKQRDLANDAVKINRKIEKQFCEDPKNWAKNNWNHPLARERADAWKYYLAVKENVLCMDFAHAMTVHKSQGSTYENVFIDMEDIGKCANSDYKLYLKLLYVAISRASDTVYTN